jgi:hypothetical protein
MEKLKAEDEKEIPDLMGDSSSLKILKGEVQLETDPEKDRKRKAVGKRFKIVGWIFMIPFIFMWLVLLFPESELNALLKDNLLIFILANIIGLIGLIVIKITEWIE